MSRALYKILVDDLLRKITAGEIAVGERLPPEAEYAEQLGVSRSTLRQAFSQLEAGGIIKRRKRGGTEVISNKPVKSYNMVTNGFYDVLSVARDTLLIVTDIAEAASGTVAELEKLDTVTDQWLVCSGCRYMAGQAVPFAALEIYVPKHYSDIELQVGDTTASLLGKLEERYGVTAGRVKREISASLASEKVSEQLGLESGSAVLHLVTQITDANDELLEVAVSIIDPARFNVTTDVVVGG